MIPGRLCLSFTKCSYKVWFEIFYGERNSQRPMYLGLMPVVIQPPYCDLNFMDEKTAIVKQLGEFHTTRDWWICDSSLSSLFPVFSEHHAVHTRTWASTVCVCENVSVSVNV